MKCVSPEQKEHEKGLTGFGFGGRYFTYGHGIVALRKEGTNKGFDSVPGLCFYQCLKSAQNAAQRIAEEYSKDDIDAVVSVEFGYPWQERFMTDWVAEALSKFSKKEVVALVVSDIGDLFWNQEVGELIDGKRLLIIYCWRDACEEDDEPEKISSAITKGWKNPIVVGGALFQFKWGDPISIPFFKKEKLGIPRLFQVSLGKNFKITKMVRIEEDYEEIA